MPTPEPNQPLPPVSLPGPLESDVEDEEKNRRAPRVSTMPDVLDMNFRIFTVNIRELGEAKYVLAGAGTGEFVATMNESNFQKVDIDKVLHAAQKREEIRHEVLIGRNKGEIRSAQIMQVF